ncbi:MAG: hydroxymethylbilane synthase [Microbacterium sp. 71-23]|uniref:hydroxymethylbilane synthase n=1 Tax=Microbacterium TaxID=33882 RepID=UPI00086A8694|nr:MULTISPECIES: hydroxymethylbilane synthase [unclassified Microbacterium]ODU77413.1 MAG: hydroxymethylbilane synthase [Microbacterium sp. SCN 71-21]OJU79203.1 MAG: hydroxymethylbilane synthase [Microbacterium sp. 71-23]
MSDAPIRLGTRRSALATAQSQQVADALAAASGRPVELVLITSEGDVSRASLSELGGRGVFATRLREALLAGECDVLVHSLKDLPTAPAPGLVIAATPPREDPRDVVVTRTGVPLHELAPGSVVGTGSPRRIAQVRRRNPRVEVRDIRGNIDSRIGRVRLGELDAVILAAAGLARLGGSLHDLHLEPLGLAEWPTAPGQGVLAVEIREDASADLADAVAALDDRRARVEITAERAVLAGLDSGCQAPVGVHAEFDGHELRVRTVVYAPGGGDRIGDDRAIPLISGYAGEKGSGDGADAADRADPVARAERTGTVIARDLLDRGAAGLAT